MGRYCDRIWNKEWRKGGGGGGGRRSSKDNLCLDGKCKKHPDHCQSPGVCSLCLYEKLSHLQSSMSSSRPRGGASIGSCASSISSSLSSSLSSFYSCSSATLASSPSRNHRSDPVPESTGKGSRPRLLFRFLGRRRAVASSDTRVEDLNNDRDHRKKKSGYGWKLIHPGSKSLFHNNLS